MKRITFIRSLFAGLFAFLPFIGTKAKDSKDEEVELVAFVINDSPSMYAFKDVVLNLIRKEFNKLSENSFVCSIATFNFQTINSTELPKRVKDFPFDAVDVIDGRPKFFLNIEAPGQIVKHILQYKNMLGGIPTRIIYITDGPPAKGFWKNSPPITNINVKEKTVSVIEWKA